jgi:enamine deaminase RidA (YjgF/YER057c/UK114 family)
MPERIILKPAGIPCPDPEFSPGLRYGRWVFTSAISAADYATGFVPAASGNPAIPLAGEDSMILQARAIMTMLGTIVTAGGTTLQQGARIDQFPTTRLMMDPYHVARREMIDPPRPASTSVQIATLLCPAATSQIELLAIIPEDGFRKEGISADIPQPLAGYSPALRVGDFVFLAGQVPTDWRSGIAPEAIVDPRFWEGNSIDREARFTLKNLKLTLEAAGSSLANVVKATIHLADINDIPRLDRVWREFFPANPPARTICPINGLGVTGGRLEITLVAVTDAGSTKKEVISTGAARPPLFHESQAIRAGEFLFLSGLLAADQDGIVPAARVNPHHPYATDTAYAQMADILDQADLICRAAGTSVAKALRMTTMATDLTQYASMRRAADGRFPAGAPVTNVFGVTGPLQVPDCTIIADMWIAA